MNKIKSTTTKNPGISLVEEYFSLREKYFTQLPLSLPKHTENPLPSELLGMRRLHRFCQSLESKLRTIKFLISMRELKASEVDIAIELSIDYFSERKTTYKEYLDIFKN